jgi:zinc finger protein
MPEEDITIKCPSCGKAKLRIRSLLYSVPYFNDLAMFIMECPECNFNHSDIFTTESRKPGRCSIFIDDPSLLRSRVVRSSSGTIRIPEFGIDVEPGPRAESFVSNVEGVLYRVRSGVETAILLTQTQNQKAEGKRILQKIDKALEGEISFTLIIEDPIGVSGILPDDLRKVKQEELSQEEASLLRGAPVWLDVLREEYKERKG